jgi:hypothetical protein
MKLSESVAKVIELSTAIDNYWNTELPRRHPHYPIISPGEDSGPPPPEALQLEHLLKSLPDDDVYAITLLMHLGRGDFGPEELPAHYEALKKRFPSPERAVAQLMGKASLSDYLTDGMAELEKVGIDLDQLTLASVSAGN